MGEVISSNPIPVQGFNNFQNKILVRDSNGDGNIGPEDEALVTEPWGAYKKGATVPFDDPVYGDLRYRFSSERLEETRRQAKSEQIRVETERIFGGRFRLGPAVGHSRCAVEEYGVYVVIGGTYSGRPYKKGDHIFDVSSCGPYFTLPDLVKKIAEKTGIMVSIPVLEAEVMGELEIDISAEAQSVMDRHGARIDNGYLRLSDDRGLLLRGGGPAGDLNREVHIRGTGHPDKLRVWAWEVDGDTVEVLFDLTTARMQVLPN